MSHEHQHLPEHRNSKRKPFHHDWRFRLAVVVMLVAIGVYILTENLRVGPRPNADGPAPATAPVRK